jgi:hypothetical protein
VWAAGKYIYSRWLSLVPSLYDLNQIKREWINQIKHIKKYMGSREGISLSSLPPHHNQDTFFTSHYTSPNIKMEKHTTYVPSILSLVGIDTYQAGNHYLPSPIKIYPYMGFHWSILYKETKIHTRLVSLYGKYTTSLTQLA